MSNCAKKDGSNFPVIYSQNQPVDPIREAIEPILNEAGYNIVSEIDSGTTLEVDWTSVNPNRTLDEVTLTLRLNEYPRSGKVLTTPLSANLSDRVLFLEILAESLPNCQKLQKDYIEIMQLDFTDYENKPPEDATI